MGLRWYAFVVLLDLFERVVVVIGVCLGCLLEQSLKGRLGVRRCDGVSNSSFRVVFNVLFSL